MDRVALMGDKDNIQTDLLAYVQTFLLRCVRDPAQRFSDDLW